MALVHRVARKKIGLFCSLIMDDAERVADRNSFFNCREQAKLRFQTRLRSKCELAILSGERIPGQSPK